VGRRLDHPLRLARQRAAVSQSQLARDLGIARGTVTAIEEGRTRMPLPETRTAIEKRLKMQPGSLRNELVAWLAKEEKVELSTRARATLQLEPRHIAHYTSFRHWRSQVVDSATGFASLLRVNEDVVAGYEKGLRTRGMPDSLAGALMNVLGVSPEYLAAVQKLPTEVA
jgi:transcriptional regulator with XRE-family HTH domain